MTDKTTSFANPTGEHSTTVGEKLSSSAGQVKDKLSDLGRTAVDTIDENRSAAASGLDKAASALHDTAGSLPGARK